MRFYYCNHPLKKAYFEFVQDPAVPDAVDDIPETLPYRVVGKHVIEIDQPISVGLLARDPFGQIWLYPNSSRDGLFYVNMSVETLKNACLRWSDCRTSSEVHEFQDWLHLEDVRCKFQPLGFWEDIIGDTLQYETRPEK